MIFCINISFEYLKGVSYTTHKHTKVYSINNILMVEERKYARLHISGKRVEIALGKDDVKGVHSPPYIM